MRKKVLTTLLLVMSFVSTANKTHVDNIKINDVSNCEDDFQTIEEPIVCIEPENLIIRDIHLLHPAFRNKIILLFVEAKKRGIDLFISETYRTPERQNMFFGMKLTKVRSGGSKHQYGLAIDVIPVINGKSYADNHEVLKRVGLIGEKLGLKWGGRWRFYDPVHFEFDWDIKDLKRGILPEVPDTLVIPDITFYDRYFKIKSNEVNG